MNIFFGEDKMEHINPEEINELIGQEVIVRDYFFCLHGTLAFYDDGYFCFQGNNYVEFRACKVREIYRNPGRKWNISLAI